MMFSGHCFHFRVLFVLTMLFYLGWKPTCEKVMFSVMSVHRPVPCHHYPRCIGTHHTRTPSPNIGPHCTPPPPGHLAKTGWRPVQTCSPEDPSLLTSGDYCNTYGWRVGWKTSYWNAFLIYAYMHLFHTKHM